MKKKRSQQNQRNQQNPILAEYKAMLEAQYRRKLDIAVQMGLDAGLMAANAVLKLGPGRSPEYTVEYITAMNEMSRLLVEDSKDDPDLVYSRELIDRRIKGIVGPENFQPWDVRYGV